ncbi:MAG: hypothetical protein QOJ63_1269 [Solirubrobacteraceae bacterium]|nr:hypothetical protein [Solirubrobacteraceae bacterium]
MAHTELGKHPHAHAVAIALLCALSLGLHASGARAAQPAVGLAGADAFAALGGSTVTNIGPSLLNGGLGVAPGNSITGFPPGIANGTIHLADAVASGAQANATTAYDDAAGRIPAVTLPGNLGGLLLTPGVYRNSSSLGLTGDVTLDAGGDPNAVFVFQVGSALTTASSSRVILASGAQACNVFWQIGSSATLGTDTAFRGSILALQSVTLTTRVTLHGRAVALNGAVTLDTNTINRADCAPGTTPGGGPAPAPGGGVPGAPPPQGGTGSAVPPAGGTVPGPAGAAFFTTKPRKVAQTVTRFGRSKCVATGFRAGVSGLFIRSVTFLVDGRSIGTVRTTPFEVLVHGGDGIHKLIARVSFTDGSPLRNISFRYRTCSKGGGPVVRPPRFTG